MSFLPGPQRAKHQQERWPSDWYVETEASVHSLFDHVRFAGMVHDPACGGGTIPRVAAERGYMASASDLVFRGFAPGGTDFLTDPTTRQNIVTNPPYKLATEFALHAIEVTDYKVAIIVRISFLAGQKRRRILFEPHPPAEVLVLSTRPSMPPGGTYIPAKGGTADYCWIVWDSTYSGPTLTKWAE